jgi:hypothetical protein
MSAAPLGDTLESLTGQAKHGQTRYLAQFRRQTETLDMGRVMAMVRGG